MTTQAQLQLSAEALNFVGDQTQTIPAIETLTVSLGEACDHPSWTAHSNRSWLKINPAPSYLEVWVDPTGLPLGTHQATLTIDAGSTILDSPQTIPVTFIKVDQLKQNFLPLVNKGGG